MFWSTLSTGRHMPDIFLSYARVDRGRVRQYARALQQQGWSVWWDEQIEGGDLWTDEIQQNLDAARCVLAFWTVDSCKSTFVRDEARYAAKRHVLVHVVLDAVKVPIGLGEIQSVDMRGWTGSTAEDDVFFSALVRAVEKKLAAAPMDTASAAPDHRRRVEEPSGSEIVGPIVPVALPGNQPSGALRVRRPAAIAYGLGALAVIVAIVLFTLAPRWRTAGGEQPTTMPPGAPANGEKDGAGVGAEGQMNRSEAADLYTKAVSLLGSIDDSQVATKAGAIYALENVARGSREYRQPVLELLHGYLRRRADRRRLKEASTDVEAAIMVLGRTNRTRGPLAPFPFDFSMLNLSRLSFSEVDFEYANFAGADLTYTRWSNSKLCGANLRGADLMGSEFRQVDLRLSWIDQPFLIDKSGLQGAIVVWPDPQNFRFFDGDLQGLGVIGLDAGTTTDGAEIARLTSKGAYVFTDQEPTRFAQWQGALRKRLGPSGQFPDGCGIERSAIVRELTAKTPFEK